MKMRLELFFARDESKPEQILEQWFFVTPWQMVVRCQKYINISIAYADLQRMFY